MKIMSYNIQNYENDWQTRIQLIAKLINDVGADIVALNEVRGHFDGTANEAEVLQGEIGGFWHLVTNEAMDYTPPQFPSQDVWEGLAILSRQQYPIIQTGSLALDLASGDDNRRIVQFASFQNGGAPFYLFNYHATLADEPWYGYNLQQALSYVQNYPGPALLVGDLNQPHDEYYCGNVSPCVPAELLPLEKAGWTDLWMNYWNTAGHMDVGYTWPLSATQPPTKRLDYQWATQDLLAQFVSIEKIAAQPVDGMYLSDHAALLSEFNF
jgi:endonuclease/exonuclease/phosphatase family metal-dependent hydrolase